MAEEFYNPTEGAKPAGTTDYSAYNRPQDIDVLGSIMEGGKESLPGMMWNYKDLSGQSLAYKIQEQRSKGQSDENIFFTIANKAKFGHFHERAKKYLPYTQTGEASATDFLDAVINKYETAPENPAKQKNAYNLAIKSLTSMIADLPGWLAVMGISTAVSGGNPVIGLAGASAMTGALKKALMYKIENGEIRDDAGLLATLGSKQFWDYFTSVMEEAGKSGAIGAGAGFLGRAPNVALAAGKGREALGYTGISKTGTMYEKGWEVAAGKPKIAAELYGRPDLSSTMLSKKGQSLKVGGEIGGFLAGQPIADQKLPEGEEEWIRYIAQSVVPILGIHYGMKAPGWIRYKLKNGWTKNEIINELKETPKEELVNELNRFDSGYDTGTMAGEVREDVPYTGEPGPYRTGEGKTEKVRTNEPWLAVEDAGAVEPEAGRYEATAGAGSATGTFGARQREAPVLGPQGEKLSRKGLGEGAAVDTVGAEEGTAELAAKAGTAMYIGEKGPEVYDPRTGKIRGKKEISYEVIDPETGEHLGWQSPMGFSKQWDISMAEYLADRAERDFRERAARGDNQKFTDDELGILHDMVLRKSPTESDFLFMSQKIKDALSTPGFQRDALDKVILQFAERSVWKAVLDKLSNKRIINEQYGVDVKDLTRSDIAGIAKDAFKPTGPIYVPETYGGPRAETPSARKAEAKEPSVPREKISPREINIGTGEGGGRADIPVGKNKGRVELTPEEKAMIDEAFALEGIGERKAAFDLGQKVREKIAKRLNKEQPSARKAAKSTLSALDEATKGLAELFGGGKSLTSGGISGFDAAAYAKAKPHFEKAWAELKAAGKETKDLYDHFIKTFGDRVRPYLDKFMSEIGLKPYVEKGGTQLGETKAEQTDFVKQSTKEVPKEERERSIGPPAERVPSTTPPQQQPQPEARQLATGDRVFVRSSLSDTVRQGKILRVYKKGDALTGSATRYQVKFDDGATEWLPSNRVRFFDPNKKVEQVPYREGGFTPGEIEKRANAMVDGAKEGWGKAETIDENGEPKIKWFKQYSVKVGDEWLSGGDKKTLHRKVVEALSRQSSKKMAQPAVQPKKEGVTPKQEAAAPKKSSLEDIQYGEEYEPTAADLAAYDQMMQPKAETPAAPDRTVPPRYSKTVEREQRQAGEPTAAENAEAERQRQAILKEREQEAKRLAAENELLRKQQITQQKDDFGKLKANRDALLKKHEELKKGGPSTFNARQEILDQIDRIDEVIDKVKDHLSSVVIAPIMGIAGGFDVDKDGNLTFDMNRAAAATGVSMAVFIGPKSKLLSYRAMEGGKRAEVLWRQEGITKWTRENHDKIVQIAKETGWTMGKDGKARYEQSDKNMSVIGPIKNAAHGDIYPLIKYIKHDKLFEQYPALKEYRVEIDRLEPGASVDVENKLIKVNNSRPELVRDFILHELNHAVDFYEGRYGGTSTYHGISILLEPHNEWEFIDFWAKSRDQFMKAQPRRAEDTVRIFEALWDRRNSLRAAYDGLVNTAIERAAVRKEINSLPDAPSKRLSELTAETRRYEKMEAQYREALDKLWKITNNEETNARLRRHFEMEGYRRTMGEAEARLVEMRSMMSQQEIYDQPAIMVGKEEVGSWIQSAKPSIFSVGAQRALTPEEQILLERSRKGEIKEQDPNINLKLYEIGRKLKKQERSVSKEKAIEALDKGRRMGVDVQGNAKAMLEKNFGEEGRWAKIRANLTYGAPSKVGWILDRGNDRIYGELSKAENNVLDDIIETRCNISILGRRREYMPQGGQMLDSQKKTLDLLKQKVGDYTFERLNKRADMYFEDMRAALKMAYEEGLISKETYEKNRGNDYKRKQVQDLIDPEDRSSIPKLKGVKMSVRTSGVEYLGEGSQRIYDTDSHWARSQVWTSTVTRVFQNQASRSLAEIYRKNPDNGIIRELKPYERPKSGEEALSFFEGGVRKELAVPNWFAKDWVSCDPEISKGFAYWLGIFTGTKLLKAMATGYNPAFILTNVPRDMFLIWGSTKEYSTFAPKAMGQLAMDMLKVLPDAAMKKGTYNDYIKDGGGIELLTYYGRWETGKEKISALSKIAGWAGETSELTTRLALRKRTIENRIKKLGHKPSPEEMRKIETEATEVARNYLDFNQGGTWAKSIDKVVPYFNASIQATRGLMRHLKDNPKMAAAKMAQVATLASALYLYNWNYNEDMLNQVPDFDKVNNWIIGFPGAYYIDDKGDKRYYYIKIAKDQGMQVIASMVDAAFENSRTGKVPTNQLWESAMNILQTQLLPPVAGAYASYKWNIDVWTGQRVYKGKDPVEPWAERDRKTAGLWDDVGTLTGLSPMRLRAATGRIVPESNFFWTVGLGGYKVLTGQLHDEWNRKTATQILSELPAVRRVLSSSNPYWEVKEESERHKVAAGTRRKVNNGTIDNLADRYFTDRTEQTAQKIDDFLETVRKENPYEAERLEKRITRHYEFWKLPNRQWWVDLSMMNDPEERAEMFYERYVKTKDPAKKQEMVGILDSITGISTGRFEERMDELMSGQRQMATR